MEYEYSKRGRCNACGKYIWTTGILQSVICSCSGSSIEGNTLTNLSDITDTEHLVAIRLDHSFEEDEQITLINISN